MPFWQFSKIKFSLWYFWFNFRKSHRKTRVYLRMKIHLQFKNSNLMVFPLNCVFISVNGSCTKNGKHRMTWKRHCRQSCQRETCQSILLGSNRIHVTILHDSLSNFMVAFCIIQVRFIFDVHNTRVFGSANVAPLGTVESSRETRKKKKKKKGK